VDKCEVWRWAPSGGVLVVNDRGHMIVWLSNAHRRPQFLTVSQSPSITRNGMSRVIADLDMNSNGPVVEVFSA
jgi:hypothetical protein